MTQTEATGKITPEVGTANAPNGNLDPLLYKPVWVRTEPPAAVSAGPSTWLIFMDDLGLGQQISVQLRGADQRVFEVVPGNSFRRLKKTEYVINPDKPGDFDLLIADISRWGQTPQKIVYLWGIADANSTRSHKESFRSCFVNILNVVRPLDEHGIPGIDIAVISTGLHSLEGEKVGDPVSATLLAPVRILPKHSREFTCRNIDCDPTAKSMSYLAVQIITELNSAFTDSIVAYRGDDRWIQSVDRFHASSASVSGRLKDRGSYLITQGFCRSSLAFAEYLARHFHARISLVGCETLPPPAEWEQAAQSTATPAHVRKTLMRLLELRYLGADVLVLFANPSRPDEYTRAVETACGEFGKFDGVFCFPFAGVPNSSLAGGMESAIRPVDDTISEVFALQAAIDNSTLDFFALVSSDNPFLTRAGGIESSAAGAFFDSFALSHPELHCVSIHFDAFEESTASLLAPSSVNEPEICERILSTKYPSSVVVTGADLQALVSVARRRSQSSVSPASTDVDSVLLGWWQDLLAIDPVNPDDDFFELGGHSLIGVQLFSKIKKTYGIDLGLSTLFEARTVRQLAQLIRESSIPAVVVSKKTWSPLVPIQPRGTKAPIFVISGLGGNVVKFQALAYHMGEDQPMYGLLPRGLDGKEAFHSRLEDVAADYVRAIRERQRSGPCHLVGYSFGGIVAFEVAQQLFAQGAQVGLLGFFDTVEWHYGDRVDESIGAREKFQVAKEHLGAILFGKERINYLKKHLDARASKIKQRVFTALGRPLPQDVTSIEEVNSYIGVNYHPQKYPGKITLFRSMKRTAVDGDDPLLGWGEYAEGGVEVHQIPSTHFNILKEPNVKLVADDLRACIVGG